MRKAADRGHADNGWLNSYHTFSFADYTSGRFATRRRARFRVAIRIATWKSFPYVLEGALAHKDSMGTDGVLRPGDVQRMSAGTGVVHSEFNGSKTEPVHFLQIGLEPDAKGIDARVYAGVFDAGQQSDFALGDGRHAWLQVAEGAVRVNGQELTAGDGVAVSDKRHLRIEGVDKGEVLVFDLQ